MKKASSPQVGSATDNLVVEAATFIGIDFHKRYPDFADSSIFGIDFRQFWRWKP